jgi:hypothetical protein
MPKQVFDALGVILDSTGHRDFLSRPNYCSLLCAFGLLAEWHNDPTMTLDDIRERLAEAMRGVT